MQLEKYKKMKNATDSEVGQIDEQTQRQEPEYRQLRGEPGGDGGPPPDIAVRLAICGHDVLGGAASLAGGDDKPSGGA